MEYRTEEDLIGAMEIPADRYWGIHTERAIKNFPLSGRPVNTALIRALALVKKACCLANRSTGFMEEVKADAISAACGEIADGRLDGQFPVDALQGGAGTSTNMNLNEVIANRALEILGKRPGDYHVIHPLSDVNLHQSTNDTFPTAIRVAAIYRLRDLSAQIADLQAAFQRKEAEFREIITMGRTELQEAVPITLGAEFSAFAEAFSRDRWRTFKCEERLRVINLGGTAVGTGLTAPRDYIFLVAEKLREITGLPFSRGENLMGETANADPFVEVSGILKAHAANLIKVAGDLRLLNLLGEIHLPVVQAGSSVMPGKVNPVVPEAVIQSGIMVSANDFVITESAARGSLQINEFLPLLAQTLLDSLDILTAADSLFAGHVAGIRADSERCRAYADNSHGIVTAFVPLIGYDAAARLIKEFTESGQTEVRAFLAEKIGADTVDRVLSPYALTSLGYRNHGNDTEIK